MIVKLIEEPLEFLFSVYNNNTRKFFTVFKSNVYQVGTSIGLELLDDSLDSVFKYVSPFMEDELEVYFGDRKGSWDEVEEWYESRNQAEE